MHTTTTNAAAFTATLDLDYPAIELAVARAGRKRRTWSFGDALAELRRVAAKHGCDADASVAEATKRLDAIKSLKRGWAQKANADRAAICDRHSRLIAYRVLTLRDGRKSRVFYCRTDDRAMKMSAHVSSTRHGAAQVVRLARNGIYGLVGVV